MIRFRFTLRGKMEPNTVYRFGGCSFELEICYLPSLGPQPKPSLNGSTPTKSILKNGVNITPTSTGLNKSKGEETNPPRKTSLENKINSNFSVAMLSGRIGIRRKRLKGDSWCYKKVCEEVLALTATELKQSLPAESSV